jgi:hypothetical protein
MSWTNAFIDSGLLFCAFLLNFTGNSSSWESLPATKIGALLQYPASTKDSRAGNAFLNDLFLVSKPDSLRHYNIH